MNKEIIKLKRLGIWSNYVKIKDIQEPSYSFFLKDTGYRLYIIDYGNGELDRWWCGSYEDADDNGDTERGPKSFDTVFDNLSESMKEKFIFNLDVLV